LGNQLFGVKGYKQISITHLRKHIDTIPNSECNDIVGIK